MNNIFDTHAHYDDSAFDEDRDSLLNKIHGNNVSLIMNCGCNIESSLTSVALSEKYDFVYSAVGIHPEDIDKESEDSLLKIKELAQHEKVRAIGEIGLDYYWDDSQKQRQLDFFEKQLIIANELDLPVIIHDREAHGDTLELVKKYKPKGVLHCYSGSVEMAKEILKIGMYIGFGGALTFKNAVKPVEVAKNVPLDRILLETDCPYMSPVPFRGKRNNSSLIEYVAIKMAEIKGTEPQTVIDIANENGRKLFRI